jgi:hypothetical protein
VYPVGIIHLWIWHCAGCRRSFGNWTDWRDGHWSLKTRIEVRKTSVANLHDLFMLSLEHVAEGNGRLRLIYHGIPHFSPRVFLNRETSRGKSKLSAAPASSMANIILDNSVSVNRNLNLRCGAKGNLGSQDLQISQITHIRKPVKTI